MKIGKIIKTLLIVIPLILSLVLMSCRSNDISQEYSKSEKVITETADTFESEEEKTVESTREDVETKEVIEEDEKTEETKTVKYTGLCVNPYFPIKLNTFWNYYVQNPSDTYEYVSSFIDITDNSFIEKIESEVLNADIKWLCSSEGMVQSEYSALMLEEDNLGMEFSTESYKGVSLPPSEKWFIGYKWDTEYIVQTTVIVEDEKMSFNGSFIIKNEIVAIEPVTVPAGTFSEAFKVDSDKNMAVSADIAGQSISSNAHTDISTWYAEDTGIIKQISKATCGTTIIELLFLEEKEI